MSDIKSIAQKKAEANAKKQAAKKKEHLEGLGFILVTIKAVKHGNNVKGDKIYMHKTTAEVLAEQGINREII